jgi:sn-glycerol 3-phosphate transport system substrate-binding protein
MKNTLSFCSFKIASAIYENQTNVGKMSCLTKGRLCLQMNNCLKKISVAILLALLWRVSPVYAEAVTITFWHSMSGQLGTLVQQMVGEFNRSQHQYHIMALYKGEYVETLTSTVAAFRAGQQPDMVQIFDVGTASMMFPQGVIVPVYQVLQDANRTNLADKLLSGIKAYYSNQLGQLMAMPFNVSSAVMFYNKNAFQKAGLDVNKPPRTWPEMAVVGKRLLAAGYDCGFTTAWPSWIQLESFCAWHNIPYASLDNGLKGVQAQMSFNSPPVVKHLANFAVWQKSHIFQYGGRNDDAQALFTSGKCPILFESSGSRLGLESNVPFQLGVAPLPYWPEIRSAPQNTMIGGGAIWVMSGHEKLKDQGIAEFFAYLLSTPVQVKWQSSTGYIPLTRPAMQWLGASGYYKKHPGAEVAIKSLNNKPASNYSKGIRLGNYTLIRQVNDTALEEIWSGRKPAQQVLDYAVLKNNILLQHFRDSVERVVHSQ